MDASKAPLPAPEGGGADFAGPPMGGGGGPAGGGPGGGGGGGMSVGVGLGNLE